MRAMLAILGFALGVSFGVAARAEPTIALKAGVHLGGARNSASDRPITIGSQSVDSSSALFPGLRLALQSMFAPHPNFALGAQLGVVSWQSTRADDFEARRSWYIDLAFAPEGRLLVDGGLTLYVVPTVGLVYVAWNEVSTSMDGAGDSRADAGWGIEYGISIGARMALQDHYGLLFEVGPIFHAFQAGLHADAPSRAVDVDVSTWQLAVLTGAYF